MIIYIITFALSLMGVRLAEVYDEDHRRLYAGSILAVLPPILIAGFRDVTVGTDVSLYIVPIFQGIASNGQNLIEFINSYPGMEWGYLFINYIIAQLTDQPFVLLICIHILVIVPLYITAMKWRKRLSPTLFMFIYYMIFFQESLSIVRQSIALSFSLLAFTFFIESKYIKYIVCLIVSFFFHQTAFITLSFPVIYVFVKHFSIRQNYLFFGSAALVLLFFFLNIDSIFIWLIENGYMDIKFLKYTTADDIFVPVLGATNMLVKIVTIAYILYVIFLYKPDAYLKLFLIMAVLDMLFSLCALILQPLDRISLYYRLITCISIPFIASNYPIRVDIQDEPYKIRIEMMFCILVFVYWYYVYMSGNYDDTADYQLSSMLFV